MIEQIGSLLGIPPYINELDDKIQILLNYSRHKMHRMHRANNIDDDFLDLIVQMVNYESESISKITSP